MANIIGTNGNDTLMGSDSADTINGKTGNDLLRSGAGNDTLIGSAGDDTLSGSDSLGDKLLNGGDGNDFLSVSNSSPDPQYFFQEQDSPDKNTLNGGAGNDTLSASNSPADNLLFGGDGNDSLSASGAFGNNTLNGGNGDDILTDGGGKDIFTGGGGKDKFVYTSFRDNNNNIADFGGVGKGTNPTAAVITEVDTLTFQGAGLTAKNLLLTQNGNNLEISFSGVFGGRKLILENFALENLDNLSKSTGATVDLGNILFDGQTTITDSFDVFNANSTQSTIFNKNTVTFLNDLDNNVNGFDNSDDVINAQGGDDKIDGLSGNDLLRGGAGNNTLNGGAGNDTLNVDSLLGDNLLSGGDGNDFLFASGYQYYFGSVYSSQEEDLFLLGNNTLNGGAGNDTLTARGSKGDNLLSGGDGNDSLEISGYEYRGISGNYSGTSNSSNNSISSGNNTLNGGAGDDTLGASGSRGDNLLSGGDGNDFLNISGDDQNRSNDYYYDYRSSGNNTLNGGAGDDTLDASGSTGDNLLSGGDGNDAFYLSFLYEYYNPSDSDLVTQTVDGGKGDDLLSVYFYARGGITTAFNATTSIGSITVGTYSVSYKNIERLNISGSQYDDNIVGSDGNDTLSGSNGGKDTIDGSKGDDLLSVDYSFASRGITTTFNASTNIGSITAGTDGVSYKNIERLNISGTEYDDNIVGNDGNDTLSTGNGGKDTIDGGKGDDVLSGNYRFASRGITTTFNASTNIGSITAGTNSVSYKNIERLNISGTEYDDNIVGNDGNDTLSGNNDDSNRGSSGNDTIDGGKGDDLLSVYFSATKGITTAFNASTNIGSMTAGTNSVSYKNIERLNISGTEYDDNIVGSNGNDTLSGNGGNDTIIGGAGNDSLSAAVNSGNNLLSGDDGNDILTGGRGNDSLYGGTGTDTFVFNSYYGSVDTIYDFNATNDLIQVSAAGFDEELSLASEFTIVTSARLSIGSLFANQFTIGTSATTSNQRFIYDNITGALYFDADGSAGEFTQVKFAELLGSVTLTENNFVVV
ncbi:MAG: calcium-binding protein [Nostoc sp.]|uniref:beta strand repeat-containing protein n=1 Tax=Nostoc sp. TaxID=1180 RepID=UPI002FF5F4AC